ncbi:MAG: chitobiase/beta-hexosaminidase C-terminal domain-containing protein, partial [Planctomycetes bacterium]|nr:chitobiase/beta-hexosaminidase C-terminal domain-containing protein [Planctomycetota bacterium]
SQDGIVWTKQYGDVALYGFSDVVYGAGMFVAVGNDGLIVTSFDGANGVERDSGTSKPLNAVAYGNGVFVAAGDDGTICTSADGIHWQVRNSMTSEDIGGVGFGGNTFVVVGEDGFIATSTDGATWTRRTSGSTKNLTDISYGDGAYAVVGRSTAQSNGVILVSTDAINWYLQTPSAEVYNLNSVVYHTDRFIAVGDDGCVLTGVPPEVGDTIPPTPNPPVWSQPPTSLGASSITMTCGAAFDVNDVEYYFDEISGNPGGTDSGWQNSRSYTDYGLQAGTTYEYRVRVRDKSPNNNATSYSETRSATPVVPIQPILSVNPTSLFDSVVQGNVGDIINFNVWNSGNGTLNYTVAHDSAWLIVSPVNGSSTGESDTIGVRCNAISLTQGGYTGTVTVTASGATGSPRSVYVYLTVEAPPQVATPKIEGSTTGTYTDTVPYHMAAVTCSTPESIIRYTLDGTTPTTSSDAWSDGMHLWIDTPCTVKAKAWRTGWQASEVAVRTFVIRVAGFRVFSTGDNGYGQLGVGDTDDRTTFARVRSLANAVAVTAGAETSFAVLDDGTARAWGGDWYGQLGTWGETDDQPEPVQVSFLSNAEQISLATGWGGTEVVCRRTNGTVAGWGRNAFYELGLGDTEPRETPVTVGGLDDVVDVALIVDGGYAVLENGNVKAWGNNDVGQLALGENDTRPQPVHHPALASVQCISANGNHALALCQDGSCWAWGSNT